MQAKVVNKQGEGVVLDIVPGIVGVLLGGWVFATFDETAYRVQCVEHGGGRGAIIVLVVYRPVRKA